MTKDELILYVGERYSVEPEYPWADENFFFVIRETGNGSLLQCVFPINGSGYLVRGLWIL